MKLTSNIPTKVQKAGASELQHTTQKITLAFQLLSKICATKEPEEKSRVPDKFPNYRIV
ncbi:MAG: hypothetical protein ABSC01_01465 [Verrucomicrobiota bacterium]